MSIFKKKDIVDLTTLKKRGIAINQEKQEVQNDYIDFSSTQTPSSAPNPLSFLDSLANAENSTGSFTPTPPTSSATPSELQHLRVKLEDLEYKLDRLMDKIAKLEENK